MPRFILVDPSLVNIIGHHYEYAAHVLNAAGREGYEPVLAANRRLGLESWTGYEVFRVYELGYWFHMTASPRFYGWLKRTGLVPRVEEAVREAATSSRSWRGVQMAARYLIRRGYDSIRRMKFARDSLTLFRRIRLDNGDVVFIPTVSHIEMAGLSKYFDMDARSSKASWHLLIRHSLDGDSALGLRRNSRTEPLLKAVAQLSRFASRRVHFYTDTQELADQYAGLTGILFQDLPIPHTRPPLARERSLDDPLRILYLGDARLEKGYHHLPRLVENLWVDYVQTHRVRFIFQSYTTTPYASLEVLAARQELERYSPEKVTLLKEPLSSGDYGTLLGSGDIILLLYDPESYRVRSSGILAEALALGIPVVAPEGTWMARQLTGNGLNLPRMTYRTIAEASMVLREVIDRYPSYREAMQVFAPEWFGRHNASRLLSKLKDNSQSQTSA